MPRVPACPEVTVYQRLASDELPEAEEQALMQHLESCEACARALAALPDTDMLSELLRQARPRGDDVSGETITRLVERLSQQGPATLPAPPPAAAEAPTLAGQADTPAPEGAQAWGARASPSRPEDRGRELYDFLAPPQGPDELGRLGHYRVLKVLGAGGMGVVFLADEPALQRKVALKAMLPALAASESARQRFLREAQVAAAIEHDHIVAIHYVGEDRGVPFIAMPLLQGESLDERLQRQGRLPLREVLRIGRQMAEGLAAAHERGLIHRDIKPANVWLEGKKGRVKILDFGLARAAGGGSNLTQAGAIVGTPSYMAPEQARAEALDGRCDLFSLGCVLYRMSTGRVPFQGRDTVSTLMAVATEMPPSPRSVNSEVSPALQALILRLLAKEPAGRPADAREVIEALAALEGDSTAAPARPGRTAGSPWNWSRARAWHRCSGASARRTCSAGSRYCGSVITWRGRWPTPTNAASSTAT
jgi:serine/threonine protein kinase